MPKGNGKGLEVLAVILLLMISLLSSLLFRASTLSTHDAVNYALALEDYNIALHQPHPPGYVAWITLLKMFSLIFDPNTASIILNAVFEGFTAYLLYCLLSKHFNIEKDVSLAVSVSWLVNPISWWYRATAENYASGAFFTMTILCLALSSINPDSLRNLMVASFLLGLSGGFRIELPIFLLPVLAYTAIEVYRNKLRSCRTLVFTAIFYVIGVVTWLLPQAILCNGFMNWLSLTLGQFSRAFSKTALGQVPLYFTLENIIKSFANVIRGNSWNILAAPMAIICLMSFKRVIKSVNRKIVLAVSVILIFTAFTSLVHLGKTGYLLPVTAVLSAVLTSFSRAIIKKRVLLVMAISTLLFNSSIFIYGGTSEDLATTPYINRALFKSIGLPWTYNEIKTLDNAVYKFLKVTHAYDPRTTMVIVVYPLHAINPRRVMYYAPEYLKIILWKDDTISMCAYYNHTSMNISKTENWPVLQSLLITSFNLDYRLLTTLGSDAKVYEIKCESVGECLLKIKNILNRD